MSAFLDHLLLLGVFKRRLSGVLSKEVDEVRYSFIITVSLLLAVAATQLAVELATRMRPARRSVLSYRCRLR